MAFKSIDVTGADYAKNFELTDHNGQVRHLTDFSGKVVVMFFGYTQCPDVCPTSMAELAEVKRRWARTVSACRACFYGTKGQLRLFTRYGSGAQALVSDIRLLLK